MDKHCQLREKLFNEKCWSQLVCVSWDLGTAGIYVFRSNKKITILFQPLPLLVEWETLLSGPDTHICCDYPYTHCNEGIDELPMLWLISECHYFPYKQRNFFEATLVLTSELVLTSAPPFDAVCFRKSDASAFCFNWSWKTRSHGFTQWSWTMKSDQDSCVLGCDFCTAVSMSKALFKSALFQKDLKTLTRLEILAR